MADIAGLRQYAYTDELINVRTAFALTFLAETLEGLMNEETVDITETLKTIMDDRELVGAMVLAAICALKADTETIRDLHAVAKAMVKYSAVTADRGH